MPLYITPIGKSAVGRDSWATDERPGQYKDSYSQLWPNKMPLLALTSMMKSKKATDQEYTCFHKDLPYQAGAVTGVYTEQSLTSAYVAGVSASGLTLYLKVAEATSLEFRPNHHVYLVTLLTPSLDVPCRVVSVVSNGANSYLLVKTLKAQTASYTAEDANWVNLIASAEPNFSGKPQIINYQKYPYTNYIETFRTNFGADDATKRTKLRTGDVMAMEAEEKQMFHGLDQERAYLRGYKTKYQNDDGAWVYGTGGIEDLIREMAPENEKDYRTDASYAGNTWDFGGYAALKDYAEVAGRYGDMKRLGFCGSAAYASITNLAELHRDIKLEQTTAEFGLNITKLIFGPLEIALKIHPLYTHDVTRRSTLCLIDVNALEPYEMQATDLTDQTNPGDDGIIKGYTSKNGMGFNQHQTFHIWHNLGVDNVV